MNSQNEKEGSGHVKAAIIGGVFALLAACIGGLFLLLNTLVEKDIFVVGVNNPNSSATVIVSSPESTPYTIAGLSQSSLIINGESYSMPDPSSSPRCVAQEVHTNGSNIVTYDVKVPSGWVMMWSSWKAKWDGDSYNQDGMLIIKGPYSGTIEINTGGSCSGPIEWYDFIHRNRVNDYLVPSRPEYTIP